MGTRDYLEFVCNIGELGSLFSESSSLDTFLQKTVHTIADHLESDVSSIYLYDEADDLLRMAATRGLSESLLGQLTLRPGEGLVGKAFAAQQPEIAAEGSAQPGFKLIPGLGEEHYRSFLALPISRGHVRIGVVTAQHRDPDHYGERDLKALRVITSQLASCIYNARLFISLQKQPVEKAVQSEAKRTGLLEGQTGAEGLAYGRILLYDRGSVHDYLDYNEKHHTLEQFQAALHRTGEQLEAFQQTIKERLADVAALIFNAHLLMLKDAQYTGQIEQLIRDGVNPVRAIARVTHDFGHLFSAMKDPLMQEKVDDIEDLGRRLIENLLPEEHPHSDTDVSGRVVVAHRLYPSDVIRFFSENTGGVVSIGGGVTSHVSILARSLDIPLIILERGDLLRNREGSFLLLDGSSGRIFVDPPPDVVEGFFARKKNEEQDQPLPQEGVFTADGVRVKLAANINLLRDADYAVKLNADGVGLYRTEFPFLVREDFPSEDEQFYIYRSLVNIMEGRPVVFRTLDIGGDKVLSYYDFSSEQNPFLGMRSIRFSLREREIFRQQIRAMLRAGAGADLSLMFPMISSLDQYLEARALVDECLEQLAAEGVAYNSAPRFGIMIELPAILEVLDDFAGLVDFFSIGTNDLIQYLLAVDRTNENVSYLYQPHHPAVLRALKKTAEAGRRLGVDVSVCGDMGRDAKFIDFFIGIGLRSFSVDPHFLSFMQQTVREVDTGRAAQLAGQVLRETRLLRIEELLSEETGGEGAPG